jgi:hypothetical protein
MKSIYRIIAGTISGALLIEALSVADQFCNFLERAAVVQPCNCLIPTHISNHPVYESPPSSALVVSGQVNVV